MIPDPSNSYDQLPYASEPHPTTHPDWLGTVGAIFGMNPAPAERCRVLELGCASGGNLLPMAVTLPESTFVGVDSSAREIAEGRATIDRAGLRNVELRHASVLDVDDGYGQFDYVICYGVFSWVPRPVQDKILSICRRNLEPDGIAYVNYNAYPGGHLMAMMREMMVFAGRRSPEPAAKVTRARALVDLLVDWGPHPQLRPFVERFAERLRTTNDSFVFHEFLEERNDRFYFLEFMDRADAADLQFLGEAHLAGMFSHQLAPESARNTLAQMASTLVMREQYLDLLQGRMFRQTLLCRKQVPLRHGIDSKTVSTFCFGGELAPSGEASDVRNTAPVTFKAKGGLEVTTSLPMLKAALACLREASPGVVPFTSLAAEARRRADVAPTAIRPETDLADRLWYMFTRGLVEIRRTPYRLRVEAGDRPRATALARMQAATGSYVTNLRHERVALDPLSRRAMAALDGFSDRARIAALLREETQDAEGIEASAEASLRRLAAAGLLLP